MPQAVANAPTTDARRSFARERRFDHANVAILCLQMAAWALCLASGVRLSGSFWLVPLIAFFCLMMQGVFSMMHECFHGHGHRNRLVNALMCWLSSTIFGASATLIRVNHLGHHVRNRTRAELVDLVEKDESRTAKTIAYYLAILGGIWVAGFLGSLILALLPARITARLQRGSKTNTYAAAFVDFTAEDFARIRLEVVGAVTFWLVACRVLGLDATTLAIFYGAFALSWSSLQWIYHVRTPLHVVEGTYNLRVPWIVRSLFLSFNYNLTHHRQPGMRWQHMHAATDLGETRPFFRTWLAILKPPAPMPGNRVIEKSYL